MAITKITIEQLPALAKRYPILDVRSPAEFSHAHIPNATSLPIFSDEERKIIGTAYKIESREKAIKLGLDFFGVKMRSMIEDVSKVLDQNRSTSNGQTNPGAVIIHCWRGGMRSAAVAWLLNFYGYEVYLLEGGYKAFRNWVLMQFDTQYELNVIGGYTGSAKTAVLNDLKKKGYPTIDLEALANHKGSAFGGIGQPKQPTQEMFENLLAIELFNCADTIFWLEDESQRIGSLNIPHGFWNTMRSKPIFFIEIPFEERLQYIIDTYGSLNKEALMEAIVRIQKRLGPLETKTAIECLKKDNIAGCFRILLSYYDKLYLKGLNNRENLNQLLNKIDSPGVESISNTEKLISCSKLNTT